MAARIVADGIEGRAAAIEALEAGGIVAFPTDTVYGIGVAPDASDGIARLFAAKRRPPERAVILLLGAAEDVDGIAAPTPAGDVLGQRFWPGGLTIALPRLGDGRIRIALVGDDAAAELGTVGLRVPDHPAPRALASAIGCLPTTSANVSGQPEARTAAEIQAALGDSLALIVDGGPAHGGPPSTVVDASVSPVRIVREGAVPFDAIAEALREAGLEPPERLDPVGR